jgi:hypothetical protein
MMYHGDSSPEDQAADKAMSALYQQLDNCDLPADTSFDIAAGLHDLTGRIQAEVRLGPTSGHGHQRLPVPAARRLLAAAAMLLPPADRARYEEEFRSELVEIALAGGGRWAQLVYAARQLLSARRLRSALVSSRRQRSLAP